LLNRSCIPETAKVGNEQKKLDDLIRALRGNGFLLHNSCMEGTYLDILQEIEFRIKSTNSCNMI